MMRRLGTFMAGGIAVGMVAGCTVFPNPEPPRVMDLAITQAPFTAKRLTRKSLRVDTPDASEPYNSSKILAKPTPWEFEIYQEVRWRDIAPVIVRDLLMHRVRQGGAFATVVNDTSLVETDWVLVSELTAFHTENETETIRVIIELHAQLIDNNSRNTLCADSFRVQTLTASPQIERVVEAFSSAGAELSLEVAHWASQCRAPKS